MISCLAARASTLMASRCTSCNAATIANPASSPRKAEAGQKLIISLDRRYVQYINRSYRRTRTLWDSRYKSSLVHAETYLLACQLYIELNPVRAAMVADPAHYRWISYRANALGQVDARLTPHPLHLSPGRTDKERQAAYRGLFGANLRIGVALGAAMIYAAIRQRGWRDEG